MNLRHVVTVWRKEILDTIRDRRTLVAGILAPIIVMPLISLGSQAMMQSTQQKAVEEKTPIAVIGAAEAPGLMLALEKSDAFVFKEPADTEQALEDGDISMLLRIPDGFEEEALTGRAPAVLTVEYEARKMTSSVALEKLRRHLDAYTVAAQASRLGLSDPTILQAIRIDEKNVSTPREMGGMLIGFFLPFVLAVWGVSGGMYTAIDAVAGEKERRTLETLVITPPSRSSLAAGKAMAVFTMSTLTIVLSVLSTYLSFHYGLPLIDATGQISLTLDLASMGVLLLVALPYLGMLAGIQVALSCFGKSFKETQNYFTGLMFAVMLPGIALVFMEKEFAAWFYAVPFANAVTLFKDILAGHWQWLNIIISLASNAVYFLGTLFLAQRMLADEKKMFKE